jgi:hypothetical protein
MTRLATPPHNVPAGLDHIVYATPSLAETVAGFADRTGVLPVAGGAHPGHGTRNYLVGLGGSAYLEIIGPDPEQPEPPRPRPFGIDRLEAPTVATWVLRPADLDAAVRGARERGYDPGPVLTMSRTAPDGTRLEWRLAGLDTGHESGLVPFLIDWGTSGHPASTLTPGLTLTGLALRAPEPAEITARLSALGVRAAVARGPRGLALTVAGPKGSACFG